MSGLLSLAQIAGEVARDIPAGSCVNLGIGMPILVAAELPEQKEVVIHSENGILGMGGPAAPGEEDWNLIDAGKAAVTLRTGGSYISHADSFALIRGGHIDVSVMGAMQVSGSGDLANWWTGSGVPGVGGAMDLAVGAKRVVVIMRHTTAQGAPKIVPNCDYPVTARGVVRRLYTDYGVFEPTPSGELAVIGLPEDVTLDEVRAVTAVPVLERPGALVLPRTGKATDERGVET